MKRFVRFSGSPASSRLRMCGWQKFFAERAAIAIDNYQLYQQFNQALEAEVTRRTQELQIAQAELMEVNEQLEQRIEPFWQRTGASNRAAHCRSA